MSHDQGRQNQIKQEHGKLKHVRTKKKQKTTTIKINTKKEIKLK